jgi:GMP synthase-like glutamine amidotransferase
VEKKMLPVVLIINLYDRETYTKELEENLRYWRVPYEICGYAAAAFDKIDFRPFSHIILTGSDFFVPAKRVLSKEQVAFILATGKPVLAQCYAFHLLAYYYGGPAQVRTFVKKHKEHMRIPMSALTNGNGNGGGGEYFVNHWNYVPPELLGERGGEWDIISEAVYVDADGRSKRYVVDAMMREYPVLCLQYHPEAAVVNYHFLYKWLNKSF